MGNELHAMCAVDAMSVPAMLHQPARILSSDPSSGTPVSVRVSDGRAHAEPSDTVVLLCSGAGDTLASACCPVIDFYTSATAAQAALERSEVTGVVLELVDALDLAVVPVRPAPGYWSERHVGSHAHSRPTQGPHPSGIACSIGYLGDAVGVEGLGAHAVREGRRHRPARTSAGSRRFRSFANAI